MDGLRRTAVAALALTPTTRLVAIGAGGWVDAAALGFYVAIEGAAGYAPRAVVADPLRLPLVEAVADRVLARIGANGEPHAQLREIWRILAPAGVLVVAVPWPARRGVWPAIRRRIVRRRVARWLAAALFAVETSHSASDGLAVRAVKSDGLAPGRLVRVSAMRAAQPAA